VRWVSDLAAALGIPRLSAYGITSDDVPGLVGKTAVASSTKANPLSLTPEELTEVMESAL
jgi:alcohol dehydrogenase class IV